MRKQYSLVVACAALASLSACMTVTPAHDIPVRQEYIDAGLEPGDTVEVVLKDGTELQFELVDVHFNAIEGPDGVIDIADIESIAKRSWETPGHPCGANEPLGCSIPEVVLLLSEHYRDQTGKFHPACVTHDFCYRHGFATYGDSRERCDEIFLADMKKTCRGFGGLNILDTKEYGICSVAAEQTYNAVRLKGEPHFRTTTSTFCEFRLE